jgi:hypothetical protein
VLIAGAVVTAGVGRCVSGSTNCGRGPIQIKGEGKWAGPAWLGRSDERWAGGEEKESGGVGRAWEREFFSNFLFLKCQIVPDFVYFIVK